MSKKSKGSPCEDWNCPDYDTCHPKTLWSCWMAYKGWRIGDPIPRKGDS